MIENLLVSPIRLLKEVNRAVKETNPVKANERRKTPRNRRKSVNARQRKDRLTASPPNRTNSRDSSSPSPGPVQL